MKFGTLVVVNSTGLSYLIVTSLLYEVKVKIF